MEFPEVFFDVRLSCFENGVTHFCLQISTSASSFKLSDYFIQCRGLVSISSLSVQENGIWHLGLTGLFGAFGTFAACARDISDLVISWWSPYKKDVSAEITLDYPTVPISHRCMLVTKIKKVIVV